MASPGAVIVRAERSTAGEVSHAHMHVCTLNLDWQEEVQKEIVCVRQTALILLHRFGSWPPSASLWISRSRNSMWKSSRSAGCMTPWSLTCATDAPVASLTRLSPIKCRDQFGVAI